MSVRPPILTTPFALLVGGHTLQGLGWSSMLLLPLYLDWLGANRTEVGAVMAASAVGGMASRPVVGWALDRVGRKRTLLVGTAILTVAMTALGLVERIGPLIFAARVLMGMGIGALFTGYFTFAADVIPASRRTEGLALFGISGLIPLMVNPLAGRLGVEGGALKLLFPGLAVVVAISALFLVPIREPDHGPDRQPATWADVREAIQRRALWPAWWGTCVFSGLVAVFMSFATVTAQSRGISDPAGLWFTYAGGAVAVRAVGAHLPARLGPSRVLAGALTLYIGGVAVSAVAHSSAAFLLAGGLAGLGHGYAFPVLAGQVVTRAPASLRGSAMALYTGLWDGAKLLLVPLFGAVADARGDAVMFAAAAVTGTVALATWGVLEARWANAPTADA